jgi:hypothetical protein
MYISIGPNCSGAYQINRYKGKKETLFFDTLMTDMKSVINVLSYHNNIDELLKYHNIIQDTTNPTHGPKARILIKPLSKCISIHDICIEFNDKDIYDFINKYKRRFNRIINYINNNEKIYFLRNGYINDNEKNDFMNIIKTINPNCNFSLVSININQQNNNITNNENYLQINIIKPDIPYPNNDWNASYLDWDQIFITIERNTN